MTAWNKPNMADQFEALLAGGTVEVPVTADAERLVDGNVEQLETLQRADRSADILLSTTATNDPVTAFATVNVAESAPKPEAPPAPPPVEEKALETPPVAEAVAEAPVVDPEVQAEAPVVEQTPEESESEAQATVSTTDSQIDELLAKPKKRGRETKEERKARLDREKPLVGFVGTQKMVHGEMVLNGICNNCVRCGMKLTDAVSIERGMGPECSSKGYSEDPIDAPDEMGAMIELAAWPELVNFLTQYYKPHGVRGLMNGLVRIAALNRKTAVHGACASAIDQLGYHALSKALRDSLAVVSIKESTKRPGFYEVWVKKTEYKREWFDQVKRIPGFAFVKRGRFGKGMNLIPVTQKRHLWHTLLTHYEGLVAKTPSGAIKIARPKK